jgi:FtsP/CotA-like multicopper oxidase with cupredoxin domain
MARGQRLGLIVVAIALAAVAFVVLRPDDEDDGGSKSQPAATTPEQPQDGASKEPAPAPKPSFQVVTVVDGKPKGGVKKITLKKGDTVRLEVDSDTAAEVHIHGYDLMKDVEAGGRVRFSFKANIEGVFEAELEETAAPIAELVVEP